MGWVSPTGHNDPESAWTEPELAHDGSLSTTARKIGLVDGEWIPYLELTHASILCSKIRFYLGNSDFDSVNVDVEHADDLGNWHFLYAGAYTANTWVEKNILAGTTNITKARLRTRATITDPTHRLNFYEFELWEVPAVVAPTVTNGIGSSSVEETTARLNGEVTDNGGENPTVHVYWGDEDGVTTPENWDHDENLGVKAVGTFFKDISGLTGGKTYYYRCYATNSGGSDWADSTSSFITKPAVPTNISATDGVHTDKVVITWTKSTGATGYQVYRDGVALGWLGDVATYDDAGASAPSITPGAAAASDGASAAHVALSLSGQSANNGTTHTYKVRARNATGESADSTTNTGYRGSGALTYQWQRSAGDSDASYSNIAGATTAAYNDIGAPANGSGRYYRCVENAAGAAQAISSADRGYRTTSPTVTTEPVSNIGDIGATGNVTITDDGGEACSERGICWNTTGNPTTADSKSAQTDSFGVGAFTRLMTGLTPGQKYYAKGYAINSTGTSYGGEVSFTTKPSAPSNLTATTISETQINLAWTKGTGAVNTVIRRKINTAPTSVTDGDEVYDGPGTSHNDTTCSPGNHYYYRAWSYHTTSGYSDRYDTADSSTVTMPTGTTEAATLIGDVNTTLNGKVTDDGGEACQVRFQYGTTAAYGTDTAWQLGKVTDATFSQRITGLTPLTDYHFRAQIKNSAGTANGADETFTTIVLPTPFLRRVLRDTFGGGFDISAANPLQVYDPAVFNSLVVYEGTATADGPNASTITDTVLATKPDFNGQLVVITSGDYKGQTRDIDQATNIAGGQVHATAAFSGIIVEGVTYVILSIRPTTAEVAAIEATLGALDTAAATGAVSDVKAAMAYLKELVTGLALDGSAPHSYDYTKATVPGWLHGFHMIRRILFVVPEVLASGQPNTVHNVAIKDELDKMGLVITITQADALTYPDYESITLTVLGSPLAGTAWNTANLAHIKAIFGLPVICVDALTAVYLKMGTDGGNADTKTVLNAIANIEASILGAGIDDMVGLAAGANTVADAGVTFSTLDMSNGNITKVWYAYESVNADTDVILGEIRKTMPDSTPGKDLDGADVPGTLAFCGCAYSMDGLNTLGKAVLHLLVEKLLHSSTAGLAVILSGEVGNLAATIGVRATPAADGPVTNTDKLMAYVKQLVTGLIATEHETEWATVAVCQQITSADAANLTAGSVTPTFPTGSTRVRAVLIATIHAANQAANTHHINLKVQGQKAAGGYGDLLDLSAVDSLGLVNLDGAADGLCVAVDVTALVDTSAAAYDFRFVVDSDHAGAVNYTTSFVLVLVYTM